MPQEYWPLEYASDTIKILVEKEKKAPPFYSQSPQLSSRPTLVHWIFLLSEQFKMGHSTVHLAVYILDRFMDSHSILVERLNLTVLASFQLAAKFEERDVVPKICELNALVNNQYQKSEYTQFESFILRFLDWKLALPTAFSFTEYYSLVAVSKSDWPYSKFRSYEEFWYEVQREILYFLDLSLEDTRMLRFKPSVVACACILLARRQLGIKPWWCARLLQVTHYKFDDLKQCASLLLRFRGNGLKCVKRKLTESPDQGYVTEDCSPASPPRKKPQLPQKSQLVAH